jgi:hypothetical protein
MAERLILADRVHRYSAAPWVLFRALAEDRAAWWPLNPGEIASTLVEAEPPSRMVWSSPWPVSPHDNIEFVFSEIPRGQTAVQMRWFSDSPPDERGVAITRQRLNTKLGGFLRGWLTGDLAWRPVGAPLPGDLPRPTLRPADEEEQPAGRWTVGEWSFGLRRRP